MVTTLRPILRTQRPLLTLAGSSLLLAACAGGAGNSADGNVEEAAQSQLDAPTTTPTTPKTTKPEPATTSPSTDLSIRSPVAGSTVPAPAWIRAHLTECDGETPTSFGYSLDSESAITPGVTLADIDTTVELPAGKHTVYFKAWTKRGLCPVESSSFTVAGTTDGITVVAPANGAAGPAPLTLDAKVATCGGKATTAFGYSVDDEANTTFGSATVIDTTDSAIAVGAHVIHFKAWAGSVLCPVVDRSITVTAPTGYDGSPTIPTPPATAALVSNLDDLTGWSAATGAKSSCADGVTSATCNPPNANFSTTVLHVGDPGSEPAGSDDSAGLFELDDSPAWATCIWGHSFETDAAARNFIWDFYVEVNATDYGDSELDFYQILGGQRFMMGTQCNRTANTWDTWNEATQHWVANPSIPCNEVLAPNAWHHVVMYLSTNATTNEYTYHTLRIDEVDYALNQTQPTKASNWPNGLVGLQVQLDANASGKGVSEYVESMKVYSW